MQKLTKQDVVKILALIKTAYPYAYKEVDEKALDRLVEIWLECLEEYSAELVKYAFKEAIKACKMPPTIADVIEQIERVQGARDKSDGELWNEYLNLIYLAKDLTGRFHYTAKEEGKTQGERAREELYAAFEGADERIKDFIGSVGNLVDVCKTDDLRQEKERFYFGIKNCRKRIKAKAEIPAVFLETAKEIKMIEKGEMI